MHRQSTHFCDFSQSSLLKANQIEAMAFGCVAFDQSGIGLHQFIIQFMAVVLLPVVCLGPEEGMGLWHG